MHGTFGDVDARLGQSVRVLTTFSVCTDVSAQRVFVFVSLSACLLVYDMYMFATQYVGACTCICHMQFW